jgi:Calpain family cysteine protease
MGKDGSMWGKLMEKVFAKLSGNYVTIEAGWNEEALRILTGAPTVSYKV